MFLIELPKNFILKNPVLKDSFLFNDGKKYKIIKKTNFYSFIAIGGQKKMIIKEWAILERVFDANPKRKK